MSFKECDDRGLQRLKHGPAGPIHYSDNIPLPGGAAQLAFAKWLASLPEPEEPEPMWMQFTQLKMSKPKPKHLSWYRDITNP